MKATFYLLISLVVLFATSSCKLDSQQNKPVNEEEITGFLPAPEIISTFKGIAFNGINAGEFPSVFRPLLVADLQYEGNSEELNLKEIPGSSEFKINQEVWILYLPHNALFGKEGLVTIEGSRRNKIKKISAVKGKYKYNGGLALEVELNHDLPDKKGWYLMTLRPIKRQTWNTKSVYRYLSKECTSRYSDTQLRQAKAIADLDQDGMPEFFIPYNDFSEGNLKTFCKAYGTIDIEFNSGF